MPLVSVLLAGLLFKAVKEYPVRELLYDRWYLLTSASIVFVSVVIVIFSSGVADRTPEGTFGVYVARFKGDTTRSLQTRLSEALRANLDVQGQDRKVRIAIQGSKERGGG
jgi:hypothetical protein